MATDDPQSISLDDILLIVDLDAPIHIRRVDYEVVEQAPPDPFKQLLSGGAVFGEAMDDLQQPPPPADRVIVIPDKVRKHRFFLNLSRLLPPGQSPSGLESGAVGESNWGLFIKDDMNGSATQVWSLSWADIENPAKGFQRITDDELIADTNYLRDAGVVIANLARTQPLSGYTCYLVNLLSLQSVNPYFRDKTGAPVPTGSVEAASSSNPVASAATGTQGNPPAAPLISPGSE